MLTRRWLAIGFDSREVNAFRACVRSVRAHAGERMPLVMPISSRLLGGMYGRREEVRGGVLWDVHSNQPMSTEFSVARFYAPLALRLDSGWMAFCDCDIIFRADINRLFALADDRYAVMVVKHDYIPTQSLKMNGQMQTAYPRKCWSSLMLINCGAPEVQALTAERLNGMTKHELHGFEWVADGRIGALPVEWNWLAGVNDALPEPGPLAVHHTLGTPDMYGYHEAPFAGEWRRYAFG